MWQTLPLEEWGAIYIRKHNSAFVEMMMLPGYVIEKLGHVPAPEIAWVIIEMKEAAS